MYDVRAGARRGGLAQDHYRYLEAGGNIVDTTDVYENGVSEKIIGRALKGVPRDDYVLATKVRFRPCT